MSLSDSKPDHVNSSQWQAITHEGSHLLIVAGPGTGKTHTLTHRIAHVAQELNSDQKILAITFTNKAANEMRERLLARLPEGKEVVTLGTFHSFCLQFLRENIHLTELPKEFRVASTDDIESLSQRLWPERKARERQEVLEEISRWKATGFNRNDSEIFKSPSFPNVLVGNPDEAMTGPPTKTFGGDKLGVNSNEDPPDVDLFNRALREEGMLDFDDLLLETLKLLETNKTLRTQMREKYPFIFVDEYQDINGIQHELLKILANGAGLDADSLNRRTSSPAQVRVFLTAIGDPNQAIYGFRGADVRFFESFQNDFPGAVVFHLIENYRSASNLLKASGQVISKEKVFDVPELTAKIYTEGRLSVYEAPTDKAEAEYVVHQIEKLVGGTSLFSQDSRRVDHDTQARHSFGDIAVLYRLNAQSILLDKAFNRSGIPYQRAHDPHGDSLDPRAEKVSLMTLHAAKGLEFPVVFIVGCEENLLPLQLENLTSDQNEERRLFYVGMTRAKERLYLIRARRRAIFGKFYENKPSPFLEDIEEQLKAYEQTQYKLSSKNKKEEEQLTLFED